MRMTPSRPTAARKQTTLTDTFVQEPTASNATVPAPQSVQRISRRRRPARSKTADTSDKILTDVLLAIKPVHLANIISREKNHEYRKYRLADDVTRLWLYETSEGGTGRSSITYVLVISFTCCTR